MGVRRQHSDVPLCAAGWLRTGRSFCAPFLPMKGKGWVMESGRSFYFFPRVYLKGST